MKRDQLPMDIQDWVPAASCTRALVENTPHSPRIRASRFPIIKIRSEPIRTAPRSPRISSFAKKSRISITNVFPSVSFTRERRARMACLLYTSDAADEEDSVDLGGRRIIKKK